MHGGQYYIGFFFAEKALIISMELICADADAEAAFRKKILKRMKQGMRAIDGRIPLRLYFIAEGKRNK